MIQQKIYSFDVSSPRLPKCHFNSISCVNYVTGPFARSLSGQGSQPALWYQACGMKLFQFPQVTEFEGFYSLLKAI